MAVAALVVSAVGTGISAYNQYQQGKAQQSLDNYNASLEDQQAAVTQRDAAVNANRQRYQNRQLQGTQHAAIGASGVVGDVGSPLLVQAKQAAYMELNAQETERQGEVAAYNMRTQAQIDRYSGRVARRAGTMNAVGTLLQGAGNAAAGYYNIKGRG